MSRTAAIVLLLSIAAAVASAAQSAAPPQQPQQSQPPPRASRPSYGDRYSILSQRNIFLRDRSRGSSNGPSTSSSTSPATQSSRRSPEESLLLVGIVVEQGEVRAYFEDIVNSTMVRVAEGDKLARGRVASIGLDAVEYEPASTEKRTFVAVGNDLTGRTPLDADPSAAAATTGPVMPSGVDGLNPNDPNLTPEQKMKLRRAMELKR